MNIPGLERQLAERTGLGSSAAEGIVDAVFAVIAEALAGDEDLRFRPRAC